MANTDNMNMFPSEGYSYPNDGSDQLDQRKKSGASDEGICQEYQDPNAVPVYGVPYNPFSSNSS